MRYALLSYLRCPACGDALACLVTREVATPVSLFVAERAERAPAAGQAFAPSPRFTARTPIAARLAALGGPAAPERNREAAIASGLLICGGCARYFPIVDSLPELLPDHLRTAPGDAAILAGLGAALPADVRAQLRAPAYAAAGTSDAGAHYKRAEMEIASKVDDPTAFFGPGFSAPFNPGNNAFTQYLVSLFGGVVRLLELTASSQSALVVDSGCGYAWTSEWLMKSGFETIGVDICRAYLEIAIERMGDAHPHLVVADVEHLPLADGCADGVLAYESFHHVPDRAKAMAGYARVLKNGAPVVLAEPGEAHESAAVSRDTMTRYGILEKGMERADVETYIAGLPFAPPEQHYILRATAETLADGIDLPSAWRHSLFHGNLFRLRKDAARIAPPVATPRTPAASSTPRTFEALHAVHEKATREWTDRVQRLELQVHEVTLDLHAARAAALNAQRTVDAMERSLFWRARRGWVWLAGVLGLRGSS
jgi:SAM-dependent methyltransferase/uncharacterized protein YbaR (Trm112 family)